MYKTINSIPLYVEVLRPHLDSSEPTPAIVFYFGGGWLKGDRNSFRHQAEYFAQWGLTCFLVDYRTKQNAGTSPFEALEDAKSAMRFIRSHAEQFHILPNKIVAAGGSAGGHLAASCALVEGWNAVGDDLNVSCIPNALLLFNPVIDCGPGGYAYDRIGEAYKEFSPITNIKKTSPPTLLLLGTNDVVTSVETAKYYQHVMEKCDSRCDVKLYKNQEHGFFNYRHFKYYKATLKEADLFLQSLGYLQPTPHVSIQK